MINTPFLTSLDPRAKIKGSRDPLGLQPLWTMLGRQVVRNLTTVTTSVRGFSVLLLGLYFAERAIAEKKIHPERQVELFLKFEQLAAYSRVAAQQQRDENYTEDEIRGIQRVKQNLSTSRGRVYISADASSQILSNQKTYGLWGLYMVAARNSSLIEPDSSRLTLEARTFVAAQYDNQKRLSPQESGQIIDFLCKDKWFESTGKDANLALKIAALLGKTLTSAEREFYKYHLVECKADKVQSSLWHAMRQVTKSESPFSVIDLHALCKYFQTHGNQGVANYLTQIQVAESVFGPAAYMFSFLLTHDGQTIEYAAKEIKKAWGAKLRQIDPESFTQVLNSLGERIDHDARTRFSSLSVALAGGDYSQAFEMLMKQNTAIMQARGGSAWVALKSRRISVAFRENTGRLPGREDLPDLWTNTYFLNALKRIGYQIDGGAR